MAYIKQGFKNRKDTKPTTYLLDGKAVEIIKDSSGLVEKGTDLTAEKLNNMENGIYDNSVGVENLTKKTIEQDKILQDHMSQLAETAKIIISEADIPISERKEGTFYCIITDKAKTVTNENIKVSPIMGLKIEE